MELNQEQLSKLDELVTLLTLSKDGAIAFVLCNEPVLRKELYFELEERLEILNKKIINIQLDENSSDLANEIRKKVSSTKNKAAIFVYGIEKASKAVTSSGKSAFLTKMNIMREEFSNINQPVIIWSNEATISKIAIEAPDFWSWRTTVFEFRMEKPPEFLEKTERITESGLENLTIDELNERYKQYSDLLNEYKKKGIVDDYKFADWYFKLGVIHDLKGEYNEALKQFNQSIEIWKKLDEQRGIAYSLHNIATIYQDKGEYDKALEMYNQSLEIKKKLGDQRGVAQILHQIAMIHEDKGDKQSLKIKEKLGDQQGIAYTLAQMGLFYSDIGKKEEAIEYTQKAIDIFEKIGLENEARKAKDQIKKMRM